VTPVTNFTSDNQAQGRPMADINSKRLNWDLAAIYTRNISATMLNEGRFNFTRWGFDEVNSNPNINFGIPESKLKDCCLMVSGCVSGRTVRNTPGVISERQLQFSDILTKVRRNMSWKFGGEYRLDLNNNTGTGGARPDFLFVRPGTSPTIPDFRSDQPGS